VFHVQSRESMLASLRSVRAKQPLAVRGPSRGRGTRGRIRTCFGEIVAGRLRMTTHQEELPCHSLRLLDGVVCLKDGVDHAADDHGLARIARRVRIICTLSALGRLLSTTAWGPTSLSAGWRGCQTRSQPRSNELQRRENLLGQLSAAARPAALDHHLGASRALQYGALGPFGSETAIGGHSARPRALGGAP
jgi:hypothetical protein